MANEEKLSMLTLLVKLFYSFHVISLIVKITTGFNVTSIHL